MKCRKNRDDVKTTEDELLWDERRGRPVYCLRGIRHVGGVKSVQALMRNVGTCHPDAKGDVQMEIP